MLEMLLAGFVSIFTIKSMALITLGTLLGIIFGLIPGLTATMAVAICLPITYGMHPIEGMALLMGLYIGGVSGGLIPAILLKIPGTPSCISTTFDGYPMAQKGEAGKALSWSIIVSFIGGILSIIVLILIAPPLAKLAVKFGPYEYFAIAIFSLTLIASLAGDSLIKGILSGFFGVGFSLVGFAPIDAYPRFTFGFDELDGGFNLLPVLIGLFAVSEILLAAESKYKSKKQNLSFSISGYGIPLKEFFGQTWNLIRSSAIGIAIGILPGIGGGTANIIAYVAAKNQSKYPEKFGTGIADGIVASESSNNSATGGALVPLISLGIPGDTVTAMLLGGLMLHGLQPGPLLFQTAGDVVYGIFASLIVANVVMVIFLYAGMKWFVKCLSVPQHILLPIITALCVVGAYGVNNRVFDVGALLFFGILGYVMIKFNFSVIPLVLGFILGPIAETNLRRGLMLSQGDFTPFVTEPIAAGFLLVTVFSVAMKVWKSKKQKKAATDSLEM